MQWECEKGPGLLGKNYRTAKTGHRVKVMIEMGLGVGGEHLCEYGVGVVRVQPGPQKAMDRSRCQAGSLGH